MESDKFDIVLDARMINHSGIGTNIKNMIPGLTENYNLILLGNTRILNSFPWSGRTRIINTISPIYSIKEQIELPIKIPKCDLFISPHYNIPIFKIRASKRAVIINDVNHLVYAVELSLVKSIYAKYMINAAIRKSDKVITISEFSKSEIIKFVNVREKEIKTVYCGLDENALKNQILENSIDQIRANYNLPKNYFLYVGSIRPHKNLGTVIKAFNEWLKNYSFKTKLVLIGVNKNEVDKDAEISQLVNQNNIFFPGFIKDTELPSIYNSAECLIFPSVYEGFGLPPLEAMICGCPVLASNSASIPEVCGDAALYFNPLSVSDLVEKMTLLHNNENLRNDLIGKGYKNILRFDREEFAKNLRKEFNDTIYN